MTPSLSAERSHTCAKAPPYLCEGSGEDVLSPVEGKCNGDVGIGLVGRAAVAEQAASEPGSCVDAVSVGEFEIGVVHAGEAVEISLGHISLEIELAAGDDSCQGGAHCYVVTFLDQAVSDIALDGGFHHGAVLTIVRGEGLIGEAGGLVAALGGLVLLAGDDIVLHQFGSPLIFLAGGLVFNLSPLHGISVLQVAGGDGEHGAALIDSAALDQRCCEGNDAGDACHHRGLILGSRHDAAAHLEDSAEGTGDNYLGRHSGGSGALGAEGYLIGTGVASLMRMAVVVALMAVPFMGVVVVWWS